VHHPLAFAVAALACLVLAWLGIGLLAGAFFPDLVRVRSLPPRGKPRRLSRLVEARYGEELRRAGFVHLGVESMGMGGGVGFQNDVWGLAGDDTFALVTHLLGRLPLMLVTYYDGGATCVETTNNSQPDEAGGGSANWQVQMTPFVPIETMLTSHRKFRADCDAQLPAPKEVWKDCTLAGHAQVSTVFERRLRGLSGLLGAGYLLLAGLLALGGLASAR
jgi:hypothetical protein